MIIIGKVLFILLLVVAVIVGGLFILKNMKENEELPSPGQAVEENDSVVEPPVESGETPEGEAIIEPDDSTEEVVFASGKPAPDFTLKKLSGEEVSLSDYRGKIVLVNFWATWCGYCDMEMPDLQRFDDENDDLVVLAVDVQEDSSIVQDYIDKGQYTFDVVLDHDGELAKTYLVTGFPTSYFIDPDGVLIGGVPGMLTYDQMNQILGDIR